MVKISKPYGYLWVETERHSVRLDLSEFLKELLSEDPKLLKKVVLKELKRKRKEHLKELEMYKEMLKKVKLVYELLDKTYSSNEFKEKLKGLDKEERRVIRKLLKRSVRYANDQVSYIEYHLESTVTSLNKIRKMIEILENTEPDLIEADWLGGEGT